MSDDPVLDTLLAAYRAGHPEPAHLAGSIDMDRAYAMQVALLRRLRDAGATHTGWKIGQTNAAMRAERGEDRLAPGFLLSDVACPDDGTVTLGGPGDWFLEPELAVVIASELRGPGIDAEAVAGAISSMHPAFELVRRTPGWNDRALQRAVNSNNAGYVLGPALDAILDRPALDELQVEVACDGAPVASIRGGDAIDNPLDSVVWLANYLAGLGETLLPGQIVLTGSYTALLPMRPGQSWRSRLDGAEVRMRTAD